MVGKKHIILGQKKDILNVVIPLASKLDVPSEAPTELPATPDLPVLGTKDDIDLTKGSSYAGRIQELKLKGHEERDARELEGIGDRWSEQQQLTAPKINSSLVGWPIEMYFELGDVEGGRHNNWYHGTVLEVVNAMRRTVRIMWNETCLAENDEHVIFKELLITF